MNLGDPSYSRFALCQEMYEAIDIIRNFDSIESEKYVNPIQNKGRLLLTGEGSSRIFPAKHMIYLNRVCSCGVDIFSEGSAQALEYELADTVVFGSSNSGRTSELISLFNQLKTNNHDTSFCLTAYNDAPVQEITSSSTLLKCGSEKAVAATKSVVEQALFFHSLYLNLNGDNMRGLDHLSDIFRRTLNIVVEPSLIKKLINAPVIYFSGRNNGVAEEITLKANEIARKRSVYLEGTYIVHGIEEILQASDVVIIFDPFLREEEKIKEVLVDNLGVEVIAIASHPTSFNTIQIPDGGAYRNYVELAIGWNILVEIGREMGIDMDRPSFARKIGNEYKQLYNK